MRKCRIYILIKFTCIPLFPLNYSREEAPWCIGYHYCKLHYTKPKLRLSAGSNLARGVSEIRDGGDLWQWSRLEVRLNAFRRSTIPQKQFIITHYQRSSLYIPLSIVISVFDSENKGSQFESGSWLCAEVSSLQ